MLLHLTYLLLRKNKLQSVQGVLNFGQHVSWKLLETPGNLLEIIPADLLDTLY